MLETNEIAGLPGDGEGTATQGATPIPLPPSLAPLSEIGGNADGGCGQSRHGTHMMTAAASTPIPSSGPAPDGDVHAIFDTHSAGAISATSPAPRKRERPRKTTLEPSSSDKMSSSAPNTETAGNGGGEDRAKITTTPIEAPPDLSHTIAALQELQFRRITYIREVNALNGRVKAMIRRALGWQWDMAEKDRAALNKRAGKIHAAVEAGKPLDGEDGIVGNALMADVLVFAKAREPLDAARLTVEKEMRKLARSLPAWKSWAEGVRGLGDLGMAVIVAEAGDVGSYGGPAKLWKRLGLAVINGERQQRKSDAELAAEHGYNPRRRAEMYAVIGDPLFRGQWRGEQDDGTPAGPIGPYGEVYAREKAKALPRIEATADLPAKERWNGMRVERHARRLMTKALLRDLWRVWRGMPPRGSVIDPDA